MGDRNRFVVTAEFITHNFKPCRVADVAGGTGQLSYYLSLEGFACTVIDPRKSDLPGDLRAKARKNRLSISRLNTRFSPAMAQDYDLIVGLHPDQATKAVAEVAKMNHPVVLVPCCNFWEGIETHGSPGIAETVRRYWRKTSVEWWETNLRMSGMNLMLVANH